MKRNVELMLVAALAVVTALLVGYALRTGGASGSDDSTPTPAASPAASSSPSSSPSSDVEPPMLSVLVLGDSAAANVDASSPRRGWVARVAAREGWDVTNLSVRGAGIRGRTSGEGSCQEDTCPGFEQLLDRQAARSMRPDIVLVAGGRDDLQQSGDELDSAARSLVGAVGRAYPEARLVALNLDYDEPFETGASSAVVQAAVRRAGGLFVDIDQPLLGRPDRLGEDGLRPGDEGHAAIARAVISALRGSDLG